MKIKVFFESTKETKEIQIEPTSTIEDIKALCEYQFSIPLISQAIFFKKKQLMNTTIIQKAGIMGLDKLILVDVRHQRIRQQPIDPNWQSYLNEARKFITINRNNPGQLNYLQTSNSTLYNLVMENNV